MKGVLGG